MRRDLRFLTCGEVDSGKSTLIGRLLSDLGALPEDERAESYAHVTDGLENERAQGITIDVAYRFFRRDGRHYRIADTPGHTQYTRNMAVAAADSECALIVADAARGIDASALRHAHIAAFFGIRLFLLAVNKMDLALYDEAHFRAVETACRASLSDIPGASLTFIPIAALQGDNLARPSALMPWYNGPSVLDWLARAEPPALSLHGMRFPVQHLLEAQGERLYAGMLSGGALERGDVLSVADNGARVTVKRLYHSGREVERAQPGQAIAVSLEQAAELGQGALICGQDAPARMAERFEAKILWLEENKPARRVYPALIKFQCREEQAELHLHDSSHPIGNASVFLASKLPLDAYAQHRATGMFLVIQPETERVAGVGIVQTLAS